MEDASEIIFALLAIALFGGILYLIVRRCVDDARLRGKSPFVVTCAVLFFFPWGWIAWIAFRPDVVDRARFGLPRYGRR